MNCSDFEGILADYLDGVLPDGERAAVQAHAASCQVCTQFMSEVEVGLNLLHRADEVDPPEELITRLAYLAPLGKTRDPFDRQSWTSRVFGKWVLPALQPRLAMGMAMTILSFAMLRRCTGVETQQLQPADLSPVRVWGGVEDKALRARDQVVKYYDNLRIVYEVETHLKDLQDAPAESLKPPPASGKGKENGVGRPGDQKNTGGRAPGEKQP